MKSIKKNMATHNVPLLANEGVFRGLAKQNMLFHQCICELIDNSIAAQRNGSKFRVDVIFEKTANGKIWLYVVDNSKGMPFKVLKDAIQIGHSPDTDNRLNEHGFGLKNALATLTQGGHGDWKVFSKDRESSKISSVGSPYISPLIVDDDDSFPKLPYKIDDIGTIIKTEIKVKYIQGVQERGKPTFDLSKLRNWLMEHLGVTYRAYLLPDKAKGYSIEGDIYVSISTDIAKVEPIEIPLGVTHSKTISMEIGGKMYQIAYNYGSIDSERANSLMINKDSKLKSYYLQSLATQGIDIRIGKRVIATKVLEHIWGVKPHNDHNEFAGELIIPDTIPRGKLKTVTTKTDFKNDDSDWQNIFNYISEKFPLGRTTRKTTEEEFKKELVSQLKRFASEEDIITREKAVFPPGVKIDVYWQKATTKEIKIYEVKTDSATALNLYQLKMYWEGLIENGESPSEGILVCLDYSSAIEEMVKKLNTLIPKEGCPKFNFKLVTLKEMGLIQ